MRALSLNGTWALAYGPDLDSPSAPRETVPAIVPGNVEIDLERAGRLPDLMRDEAIFALRALEGYEWEYRQMFRAPDAAPGESAELVFGGVDCLADVVLNDYPLGRAENALIAHRFPIPPGLLRADGDNELRVRIASSVRAGRARLPEASEFGGSGGRLWESLGVRKAPHCYGWDILPRAVSAGLWRDVTLEYRPATRLRSVYWFTRSASRAPERAVVCLDWDFVSDTLETDDWRVRATLALGGRIVLQREEPALGSHGRMTLPLNPAALWYPRGAGPQPLYDAAVELIGAGGEILDRHETRLGVRTIQLDRTDTLDADGAGRFHFIVNGEPIFIKGTNWVPVDALHSRDRALLPRALAMLAELNCNMVRCWGGNVYEDHPFFDFCDANGILVWQDFAFACAQYPQDAGFLAAVEAEAAHVVREYRNHCSLALWAGNNEIDQVPGWMGLAGMIDPNDDRISRHVLPEVVRRNDLTRPYLPSSPYHSPALARLGAPRERMPEVHLWGARPDYKDSYYADCPSPFVSEIGYHGCPSRATMEQMLSAGRLWPWRDNPAWEAKAVAWHPRAREYRNRIELMTRQLRYLFDAEPDNLDDYILASQLAQMEALKFFIERWRLRKATAGGILWWNLRDGWPVISDAVVDYWFRPKLAYRAIQRAQADVCLIVAEPRDGEHSIVAVNDTLRPVAGEVVVREWGGGGIFRSAFQAPANGLAEAGRLPADATNALWLIEWRLDDGTTGRNHYLRGPRPLALDRFRQWLPALEL